MFKIPTDKIWEVIATWRQGDPDRRENRAVEDDGSVKVASADGESIKAAIK